MILVLGSVAQCRLQRHTRIIVMIVHSVMMPQSETYIQLTG